jgi:hypothetical protein
MTLETGGRTTDARLTDRSEAEERIPIAPAGSKPPSRVRIREEVTTMFLLFERLHPSITPSTRHRRLPRPVGPAVAAALVVMLFFTAAAEAQHVHKWSSAVSVDPGRENGVNTSVNDGCPIEAPDGHMLFIATDRVAANGLDIWVAYRDSEQGPWGNPEPLPAPVNTGAQEFCPTPLPGNQLLFVRSPGACGGPDIYYTRLSMSPLHWTEPVPLPCAGLNSTAQEFSPSLVQAKGRTFLFFSSNRDTGVPGVHKIYSTELLADGTWAPVQRVDELNSPDLGVSDARPNVRSDGLEIVFDSNRDRPVADTDIFIARRHSITAPWSPPRRLTSSVNGDGAESRASLSRDGTRLYFGSTRANTGGDTGGDVYVSTRTRKNK